MKVIDREKEDLKQAFKKVDTKVHSMVPVGYIPIQLSSNGKFGVPKTIHIRNFQSGELLDLSMFNETALPERVISILNSMIYEEIDVSLWPDRLITELLVRLHVNFFTPIIEDVIFPWNEEDIAFLIEEGKKDQADDLQSGKWKPTISVDLRTLVIEGVAESVKNHVVISKKRPDGSTFSAKFISYPRYGDTVVLKRIIEDKYSETDKKYEDIKGLIKIRNNMLRQGKPVEDLPTINEKKYHEWQVYEADKSIFIARALQAMYLVACEGNEVADLPIEEKIEYTMNPEMDVNLSKKLNKHFESLKFGIMPDVTVNNPITKKSCSRRFSFRDMDIIQALREATSDGYDLIYDD